MSDLVKSTIPLWTSFDLSQAFKKVLIDARQCQVTLVSFSEDIPAVPPSFFLASTGCQRESFILKVTIPRFDGGCVREALCRLSENVPVRSKVWLKWVTAITDKEGLNVRSRLHTDVWIELCKEFPFLSMSDVIELALLSPEKRRLAILGRPLRQK